MRMYTVHFEMAEHSVRGGMTSRRQLWRRIEANDPSHAIERVKLGAITDLVLTAKRVGIWVVDDVTIVKVTFEGNTCPTCGSRPKQTYTPTAKEKKVSL